MSPLARTEREVAFWVGHVQVGVATVIGGSFAGIGYLLMTPEGPHRKVLLWAAIGCLLSGPLVARMPHQRIVVHPRGALFYYGWNLSFCMIISALAFLDGGSASPLVFFYPINTIISSVAFSRRGAVLMTTSQVASYQLTRLAGGPAPSAFLFTAVICLVSMACLYTAERLRHLLEQQEGLAAQLGELAHVDGLTGCLNYRSFHERLGAEVDRCARQGTPLALVIIDLDGFKQVNDSFGHMTGDAILQAVAHGLTRCVRSSDIVSRFGGDEFAVLAPGTTSDVAGTLVDRLLGALRGITDPMPVPASAGCAQWAAGMTGDELFQEADRALYDAKRRGGRHVPQVAD